MSKVVVDLGQAEEQNGGILAADGLFALELWSAEFGGHALQAMLSNIEHVTVSIQQRGCRLPGKRDGSRQSRS
jgi:hypothetical protein